jgi:cell division septal protein FtsQ
MNWFGKRTSNRRHARQQQVLNVKLRSDHVRALRARGLAVMVGLLCGTVFTVYVLWRSGEWLLNRLVYENEAFAIQQVDIETDGVFAPDQLRRWSTVKTGQNLFTLDLALVRRSLELVPNIESVSVERVLPHTVRLRISERTPIAQVNLPRLNAQGGLEMQTWLLDDEGFVVLPVQAGQRRVPESDDRAGLPRLTGLQPTDLRLGAAVQSPRLLAALRLVGEFGHSPMAGVARLQCVDVSDPRVLVALTAEGTSATLRPEPLPQQLRRWREIHDLSRRLNKSILSLELAVSNNVPVRWADARVTPPPSRRASSRRNPLARHV